MRLLFLFPWLLATACDQMPYDVPQACGIGLERYAGESDALTYVELWVQPDSDLSRVAAQEGCEFWLPKGIQCYLVPVEGLARIRVYADHAPCAEDADGSYVLGRAYAGGSISVQIECLRKVYVTEDDGRVSRAVQKLVIAHEVGHQTGMWWHVPPSCDADAATNDDERRLAADGICGESLMNRELDLNDCVMTDVDAAAFDRRTPGAFFTESAFGQDGCILRATE